MKVTNYNKTTNKVTLSPQHDETKQDKLTAGYGITIEDNVLKAPLFTRLENATDLNTISYGFVRGDQLINAPSNGKWYIQAMSEGANSTQIAWNIPTSNSDTPVTYRRDKINHIWGTWFKPTNLQAGRGIKIENNTINSNIPTAVEVGYELNNFSEGLIKGAGLNNAPDNNCWVVTAYSEGNLTIQEASKFVTTGKHVEKRIRYKQGTTWTEWVDTVPDVSSTTVLSSPNGTKYNLSVSDDGALQVTPQA